MICEWGIEARLDLTSFLVWFFVFTWKIGFVRDIWCSKIESMQRVVGNSVLQYRNRFNFQFIVGQTWTELRKMSSFRRRIVKEKRNNIESTRMWCRRTITREHNSIVHLIELYVKMTSEAMNEVHIQLENSTGLHDYFLRLQMLAKWHLSRISYPLIMHWFGNQTNPASVCALFSTSGFIFICLRVFKICHRCMHYGE